MANKNQPLAAEIIAFVAGFPSASMARCHQTERGNFVAVVDCGPRGYASDADMPEYGKTAAEACDRVKAHLLDDLECGGLLGKRRYQPHWDAFDIRYRLGRHWEEKMTANNSEARCGSCIITD